MTLPKAAIDNRISVLFNQLLGRILKLILLITIICIFVPFDPAMPVGGLDASWAFGMTQALAQGLSFGKELIFTFGPYASIYTKNYHPSRDVMMMVGSLYMAISYWLSAVCLMRGAKWPWIVAFFMILAGLKYLHDPKFLSYPLLVALNSFKILSSNDSASFERKYPLLVVALLFAPFGMLPLAKVNVLILCAAIGVLCSIFFAINKRNSLALICLISPSVSMIIFWVASGQKLINLPNYLIGMVYMISGYTEAMAIDGDVREIYLYSATSIVLFVAIFIQREISSGSKIFLFCVFFVFLFLCFKSGFVRHDIHATISGTAILMAAMLLPFIFKSRAIFPVIAISVFSCSYIGIPYKKTPLEDFFHKLGLTYSRAWNGFER